MVSWGSAVILVLMILIFGFYFQFLWISIALAVVILLIATATDKSTPQVGAAAAGVAAPAAPQAAAPQQPQIIVVKEQIRTQPRLSGWKPTWNRSPIPITVVDKQYFDPLWKKVARGLSGQIGKGLRGIKDKMD